MLIIRRPQTNPWFNIAAEEYLLKSKDDDYFMLWQNEPAVIVGKHQNTLAEIDFHFLRENNIPVIRRITGGGTVYHDPGNLNFTFIQKGKQGSLVDFRKYMDPIIAVLQDLGLDARHEGKNNIVVDGLKVSGNSEHVFKNKVLHHGTLLFSSDLNHLNGSITLGSGKFRDKSVKSIRAKVTNISGLLREPITIEAFRDKIINFIFTSYKGIKMIDFSRDDIEKIQKLANEKYKSWKWNFGYSPEYHFTKSIKKDNKEFNLEIRVKNGQIVECRFQFSGKDAIFDNFARQAFSGRNHNYLELEHILHTNRDELKKWNLDHDSLLKLFF